MTFLRLPVFSLLMTVLAVPTFTSGQAGPMRGSITEDRKARKLLEAGDARERRLDGKSDELLHVLHRKR